MLHTSLCIVINEQADGAAIGGMYDVAQLSEE